jgi:2-polyprenyl-3-methyl-5-hydroxy-6-metoxy-1,4-benzoquinol methylase
MRKEGLERLQEFRVKKNNQQYLVMSMLVADLKEFISRYAFGKVLDIGCGNKPYESLFENIQGYTGCDVVQSSNQKVDIICEATDLNIPSNEYDTVFSTQVLEHVDDPFQMLNEAFRVLKSNGCIILTAPFAWELHEEPYDFYRYSKYGLKSMFEKAGFTNVEIKPNGGKWAAIFQLNLNIIYTIFKHKGIFRKLLKGLFMNLHFTALINSIACWMDKKYYDPILTLNYIVTARKA